MKPGQPGAIYHVSIDRRSPETLLYVKCERKKKEETRREKCMTLNGKRGKERKREKGKEGEGERERWGGKERERGEGRGEEKGEGKREKEEIG